MPSERSDPRGEKTLKGPPRPSDSEVAPLLPAEGTPIERSARLTVRISLIVLVLGFAFAALGCAGKAWDRALATDTPQAYYQFIRKYPDSDHTADAQERIEFHKVKRRPSLERYEEFRSEHPDSPLLAELRPLIEGLAFDAARAAGTAEAYAQFAEQFPGDDFSARALGNAAYLEADGFDGDADALRAFAAQHPESDFSAEAERSVAALDARQDTGFRRVGLVIDIAPGTPEVDRLIKAFTERAKDMYGHSGVQLVVIPEIASPNAPGTRLVIKHSEGLETPSMSAGNVARAGAVARTVVTLRTGPDGPPIFERQFELRLDAQQRIGGASMLFSSREAKLYWDQFFVPVASWQSSAAVRAPFDLEKKATAVDAVLGRAVVLFSDGDFELLGLADPEKPVVLARYDRTSKLEHFEGVKIVGNEVMLYGQDGLELVSFTPAGPTVTATHSRGTVGSVSALVPTQEGLLLASSQGLLLSEPDGSNPERIMRRIVRGLAAMNDTLVFTDGESVFVATLPLLRQNRVIAQLRLGREFKPERVRVIDTSAIVMGQGGVLVIDLRNPGKPRVVSKLARNVSGLVEDAVRVGDRVFLLGSRGVQLLDPSGKHIVEAVDVAPRQRLARTGRHMVIVGEKQLQVVDGLPFEQEGLRPASPSSF